MARAGSFSGSTFQFGAPLLSVHPLDNKFPDLKEGDDEGEIQPIDEQNEATDKKEK